MNKILAVHPDDKDVVVQPTVGWQELNTQLEESRLFFSPHPGPGAQIGGNALVGETSDIAEIPNLSLWLRNFGFCSYCTRGQG